MLGIWDSRLSPVTLGGLLILAEELQIQCRMHTAELADVCIVGDTAHIPSTPGPRVDDGTVTLLGSSEYEGGTLLSALLDIEGIGVCYRCDTAVELQDFLRTTPYQYITWPALNEEGPVNHRYSSTLFVQQSYRENGFIPRLSCKTGPVQWAVQFMERFVTASLPVAVHLKYDPNKQGDSNADLDAWLSFFKACYRCYDATFILIGNETIDRRVCELPNTLVAQDYGSNLSGELALIQTAPIFMGMATGPCNMAIFGENSYIIFKNPDHDTEEMKLELGTGNQFPFATPLQRLARVFETGENLMTEFDYLYTCVNRHNWKDRLVRLRQEAYEQTNG